RKEKSITNVMENQKNENTLTATGIVCLDFLMHVATVAGRNDFISETGSIRVSYIDYVVRMPSGQLITRSRIHHHSFSAGEASAPRHPVSDASIQALHEAIDKDPTSRFINQRRHLHLAFLEFLGPRRGELAQVTLQALAQAEKMKYPELEMQVFKQGKVATRRVPITNMLLGQARKFINTQRAEIILKHTKNGEPDHGYLFISHTTGAPLAATTLTNEIDDFRRATEISKDTCAHMFRHAFLH
ncbi:tyrosine-type recombinase/integrase, partial [Pseudomonas sp. KCJK9000]|uniref:tyrosine-type recombinase/integrase n=1 Tax=Pseudomonas sp. KCJK9000 TaxID=3344566 RepID=UPI003905B3CC